MTKLANGLLIAAVLLAGSMASADDHPLLWQVKAAHTVDYLLGSVHVQPKDANRLPAGIETAYRHAKGLVFETDIRALETSDLQQQFLQRGRAPEGESLSSEVGPGLAKATQARLGSLGATETLCDALRAWLCGTFIEVYSFTRQGFSGEEGIDRELHARAVADHKPERAFETPAQQLELLAGLPSDLAREFLQSSLEDSEDSGESAQSIYQAWRTGDEASLAKIASDLQSQYPKLYDRLLAARNRAWMPALQGILAESQTQLIVAGALHFVGPDGLVAALRANGYAVTAVVDPSAGSDGTPASAAREP